MGSSNACGGSGGGGGVGGGGKGKGRGRGGIMMRTGNTGYGHGIQAPPPAPPTVSVGSGAAAARRLPPLCRSGFNSYEAEAKSPCELELSEASTPCSEMMELESADWEEQPQRLKIRPGGLRPPPLGDVAVPPPESPPGAFPFELDAAIAPQLVALEMDFFGPQTPESSATPVDLPPPPTVPPLAFVPAAAAHEHCAPPAPRAHGVGEGGWGDWGGGGGRGGYHREELQVVQRREWRATDVVAWGEPC